MKRIYAVVYKNGVKIRKSMLKQSILKWIEESIDDYVYIPALPALLLTEKGVIEVYDEEGALISFKELFKLFSNTDPYLLSKYLVFRDLASKGFYIKDISQSEYLIFEVKKRPQKFSRYVLILEEGRSVKIETIMNLLKNEGAKNNLIACVERRGGVTYYEVSEF